MRAGISRFIKGFLPAREAGSEPAVPGQAPGPVIQDLLDQLDQVQAQLAMTEIRLESARAGQAAIHRQAGALRKDWPVMYQRYFTKQGEAERREGKQINGKNKARK